MFHSTTDVMILNAVDQDTTMTTNNKPTGAAEPLKSWKEYPMHPAHNNHQYRKTHEPEWSPTGRVKTNPFYEKGTKTEWVSNWHCDQVPMWYDIGDDPNLTVWEAVTPENGAEIMAELHTMAVLDRIMNGPEKNKGDNNGNE
jgi:hypothetical protein